MPGKLGFQEISGRITGEFEWMDGIKHEEISESHEPKTDRIAFGAFRGGVDLACVAWGSLPGGLDDHRSGCVGVALVRPAVEWCLRGVWLRHKADPDEKRLVLDLDEKKLLEQKVIPPISELATLARDVTAEEFDCLERLGDILHRLHSHVHGGRDAMLMAASAKEFEARGGFGLLADAGVVLCLTAYRANFEMAKLVMPNTFPKSISEQAKDFKLFADSLLGA